MLKKLSFIKAIPFVLYLIYFLIGQIYPNMNQPTKLYMIGGFILCSGIIILITPKKEIQQKERKKKQVLFILAVLATIGLMFYTLFTF